MALFCGCRSLPDIELGTCKNLDYNSFTKNFQFDIPNPLKYRYTLRWRNRTLIVNGLNQVNKEGGVNIAGFTNIGITLYSARWQDGQFEILKNNIHMPDNFLKKSILHDVLLLNHPLSAESDCIRQDISDGSLWLETNHELGGGTGYFVLRNEQPAWGGIRKGKICFMAIVTRKKKNTPELIKIENFNENYKAEIRFINGDSDHLEGI